MNKKTKQQNKEKAEFDILELDAEGFEIIKFSDVHWRVRKVDEDNFQLDVWPTVRKVMSLKNYKAFKYENLYQTVKEIYDKEVY